MGRNSLTRALSRAQRGTSNIQDWIAADGPYPPESGRYHLFVNFACGWSHRVMLVRSLKGLEDCISLSHTGLHFVHDERTGAYRGWPLLEDPTGRTLLKVVRTRGTVFGFKRCTKQVLGERLNGPECDER